MRLDVQYDGTAYGGFSRQPNARSIQAELEAALEATLRQPITVVGAGRTDAGVHAVGQVVSFRTWATLPVAAMYRALNARLPRDIAVLEATEARDEFHARRSAKGRWYRYVLWRGRQRNVWWQRYSYHVSGQLNLGAMREASASLLGRHDFRAFATDAARDGLAARGTTRCVYRADWTEARDFLYFDVCADGFLRQMVRGIVGTMLWVGRGKFPPSELARLLEGAARSEAGPNAPAHGLTLVHVEYETAQRLESASTPEHWMGSDQLAPWPWASPGGTEQERELT